MILIILDATFSIAGNDIIGDAIYDHIATPSTSYSASITVAEGSTIADGFESLSYSIYVSDTFGNSSIEYTGADLNRILSVPNGTFILDGTSPTISAISFASGTYKVGDSIGITVTTAADDSGALTYTSASFNNQDITDFTVLSTTSYSFTYQVQDGDDDRNY